MGARSSTQQTEQNSSTSYTNTEDQAMADVPSYLHAGPIHSLCRVDESHLLSGGTDKDIILYCWTNHQCPARFRGPTKDITRVDYNPAAKLVHAAARDRLIYQWKWPLEQEEGNGDTPPRPVSTVSTRTPRARVLQPDKELEGHTLGVTALASSNDNEHYLCSGSRDNSVCLWDVVTGKSLSSVQVPRNLVTELCWIEGEMAVLQSSEDKTLRLWDMRSCSVVQQFRARQYVQTCCAVSPDGNLFLAGSSGSGSNGAELTLWDRRKERRCLREFKGHTESVQSCMFFRHTVSETDFNLIVSAGSDSTVKLWDESSADVLHSEYLSGAGPVTTILSPSQGLIACSTFKSGMMLWTVHLAENDSSKCSLSIRAKY